MKKSLLFFLFFITSLNHRSLATSKDDIKNLLKNHQQHELKNNPEQSRCANLYGNPLYSCLKGACNKQQFKKDFLLLKAEQKNEYILSLSKKDEFETIFDVLTEEEYKNFINSLSPEIRNQLPQDKAQQKKFLENLGKSTWSEWGWYIGERVGYVGLGIGIGTVLVTNPQLIPGLIVWLIDSKNNNKQLPKNPKDRVES
jgi:hypothetical protein